MTACRHLAGRRRRGWLSGRRRLDTAPQCRTCTAPHAVWDRVVSSLVVKADPTAAAGSIQPHPGLSQPKFSCSVIVLCITLSCCLQLDPGDPVETLHAVLEAETGVPSAQQRLLHNGRELGATGSVYRRLHSACFW
jgi:hypothetical protein